jgi:hypothetical protein
MKTFYVLIKTNCPSDCATGSGQGQSNEAGENTFYIGSDNGLNLNIDSINHSYMQTLKKLCREAGIAQTYFTHLYSLHLN